QRLGRWDATPAHVVTMVRAYYTNDGDLRRYLAYADAALGRPHHGFYVRSMDTWLASFSSNYESDDSKAPTSVPSDRPLVPYRDYAVEYPPGFFLLAVPV